MSETNTPKELRGLSQKELSALVKSLREEAFNLRLQQATGQLENNQRIRTVRKQLARVLTILGETGEVK